MIRVLQIAGLNRGGLETFIMNVYRKIDRSKIQFDFLTHIPNGDYAKEIISLGGKIYYIPPRNKGFRAYYKALDNFFARNAYKYQAVHMHVSSLTMASTLYYPKKYGIKIRILHSHSSSISANHIHYLLHWATKPFVKKLATHYFGCSDKALDWLYNYTGVRNKAIMINNGIDIKLFKYNIERRNYIRKELKVGNCDVLGHVGRFSKVKNHQFLLSVFNAYLKIHPKSKLILVGEGDLMVSTKEKARKLGIIDNIYFMGIRSDIQDLLQAMDIFVMPSLFEGLPVSLIEAQAAGLPILATDVISHDTDITNGFHCKSLTCPAEEWAEEINSILSNFTRKDTTSEVKMHGFDINETVKFLEEIYCNESQSK